MMRIQANIESDEFLLQLQTQTAGLAVTAGSEQAICKALQTAQMAQTEAQTLALAALVAMVVASGQADQTAIRALTATAQMVQAVAAAGLAANTFAGFPS